MKSRETPMLTDLIGLDPERDTTLDVRTDPQAQAILNTVLDSELSAADLLTEGAQDEHLIPSKVPANAGTPRPRRRAGYLVGAAAGVVALAVGLTVFSPTAPDAFASWTPVPQNVSTDGSPGGDPLGWPDLCVGATNFPDPLADPNIDPGETTAPESGGHSARAKNVITERRGDFIARVIVDSTPGEETLQFCLRPPEGSNTSGIAESAVLVEFGDASTPEELAELIDKMTEEIAEGIRRDLAAEDVIVVDHQNMAATWFDKAAEGLEEDAQESDVHVTLGEDGAPLGEDVATLARTYVGRLGSDVSAITLNLSDGSQVEANIDNGWWTAWWPAAKGNFQDATVTTSSGSTTIKL